MRVIQSSFKILDWFDNLTKEEVPPEWMWPLDHELQLWFEEVERARESRYGGGGDEDPPGGMMSNEYADELRRG